MPEIARPTQGNLPSLVFQPPNPSAYFGRNLTPLTPDTTSASAALGYAEIAKALGELPGGMMKGYESGVETGQKRQIADAVSKRVASGDLTGITMDSTGKATYADPTAKTAAKGDLFNFLQGQHYGGAPAPTGVMPLGTPPASQSPSIPAIPANPANSASSGYTDGKGSVFGLVPDGNGGFKDDPNDITDAGVKGFSAKRGAWGHDLKDPNLMGVAITPAELRAAGIDLSGPNNGADAVAGYQVEVIGPDGKPRMLDIVDKNGTAGRADFTLAAYKALGGPESKNGGLIQGIKYRIVPRGASQAAAGVAPEQRARIEAAAKSAASQITGQDLAGDYTASAGGAGMSSARAVGQPAVADRVARVTVGRDPSTGAMIYAPTPTDVVAVTPSGDKFNISPSATAAKAPVGQRFESIEALKAAGLDPEGATLNPDGSFTVEKYKAGGTDEKGRGKVTDAQKNSLISSAELASEMDGIEGLHKKLYDGNKAGPIAGRWQQFWAGAGRGDAEFVETNGTIKVANFKIARLLNGPGVLTDKDIQRAQEVAPTLNETPESFAAKMRALKKNLAVSIRSRLTANAGQFTPEQVKLGEDAIAALGITEAAPIPGLPALPAGQAPVIQATPAAGGAGRARISKMGEDGKLVVIEIDPAKLPAAQAKGWTLAP